MGLFGNQSAQSGPPIGAVQQLRSQSKSDHEIIDTLSRQGYSSIDIYNALNQADQAPTQNTQAPSQFSPDQAPRDQVPITEAQPSQSSQNDPYAPPTGVQNTQPDDPWGQGASSDGWPQQSQPQQSSQPPQNPEPAPQWQPEEPIAPQQSTPQSPQPSPQQSPQPQQSYEQPRSQQSVFSGPSVNVGSESIDSLDQIAEAIIDEKWKQLKAYIEKIVDWKGKVEGRILAIEQNQKQLGEQIIGLQKSLVDKVQTYDRHITDVGTEIKAMEKVFQKIIPSLTDNVNELSNVVHRMKDER